MKISRFFILSLVSLAAHVCLPEAQAQTFPEGSNDFASATVIDPTRSYARSSSTDIHNYSRETGEPGHGYNNYVGAGKSAWWSFTPTVDSYCQVDTMLSYGRTNPIADTILSVYTGTSLNALTRVAASDDYSSPPYSTQSSLSLTTFIAKKGTTYWIAADSYLPTAPTAKNVVLQLRHTALKKSTFTTILPARDDAEDVASITYTTTPQGGLSGKLTTRNKTYSFAGPFSLFGYYTTTLQLKAKDGSTQALSLQVDG